ncbi:putative subtilisin-like protease precursor [Conidiobolus coronatus NRRL 28638]|uniref:Putative subtilisin-like protease n=1 Tax=Conidiobolus coronatus (strain ATCC 28846 / CBS 209.66 / NRRL 28638) TaxID=796925 RepID=A0A137NZ52_CONC2|nr:putative subtilisin-like protease precursor [Conidiobolus coronatus NRRL 28638]|eukprot:KXN68105.1 putative subtilisin-like protease precursor [Conidiobolus coronatus NRRL 28638]
MKFITISLFAASLVQGIFQENTEIHHQVIPGRYIITFKTLGSFESHIKALETLLFEKSPFNKLLHIYGTVLNGVSGRFDPHTIQLIKALPFVDQVASDELMHVLATQDDAPWGLARVSQRPELGPSPFAYHYDENAGEGVNVYVIDSGINNNHQEFTGRFTWGTTTASNSTSDNDNHGHGSHCAGTIGGTTYGVAKKAHLIAVKVMGDDGSGATSDIIAGIDWVVKNKSGKNGNVISMSIGGFKNPFLDLAVDYAVSKGIVAVAAAGNSNLDACLFSPASALRVISVGATDINDNKASFSNHGICVDIHAPGVNILSSWKGDSTASNTISGTSMACPHVAGLAATIISQNPQIKNVKSRLIEIATSNKIKGLPLLSFNRLGYNGIDS